MKILLVGMNSIHLRRWSDQLKGSGHELFWFDILDQGPSPSLSYMTQFTAWKKGFLKKRGRSFLKQRFPRLFLKLSQRYDVAVADAFEQALQQIQPDLVHSFALYISCGPILKVMQQQPHLLWAYSSWGSDLFYYQHLPNYLAEIKAVLPRVNFLFTDCHRDAQIAQNYGFKGEHLGVFPGGGGFDLAQIDRCKIDLDLRKVILIKGNENRSGRALAVLQALEGLGKALKDYKVIVFGAENEQVLQYTAINNTKIPAVNVLGLLPHQEVLQLMGQSLIYIGNSTSDGMPNTMLEAICAGAFPIQSNPGGATAELIDPQTNGALIRYPEDISHIQAVIQEVLTHPSFIKKAVAYNTQHLVPKLEREFVKKQVWAAYQKITAYD